VYGCCERVYTKAAEAETSELVYSALVLSVLEKSISEEVIEEAAVRQVLDDVWNVTTYPKQSERL
jgi:hypothetical protein